MPYPRKPSDQIKLDGNTRRRPVVNVAEPQYRRGFPDPPDHIAGEALRHWRMLQDAAETAGCVRKTDAGSLAILCDTWANIRRLDRLIEEAQDEPQRLSVLLSCWTRMVDKYIALSREYGFTPKSRNAIRAPADETADDLSEFLYGT